jgi:hypothetical protein
MRRCIDIFAPPTKRGLFETLTTAQQSSTKHSSTKQLNKAAQQSSSTKRSTKRSTKHLNKAA